MTVSLFGVSSLVGPLAFGATINFTVENSVGTPQSGVAIYDTPGDYYSNANGQVAVAGLSDGQTIYFSRDTNPGCTAPEGSPGQAYTVPNPIPASATITLPFANGAPAEPGISNSERGEVGLINQARAANGLQPVQISLSASAAADGYSNFQAQTGFFGHCGLASPKSRLINAGYPFNKPPYAWGENAFPQGGSAHGAFNGWMADPPHRENILNPSWTIIGVGRVKNSWTTDFTTPCTWSAGCERAQLTGDYGDPSLADGDPSEGLSSDLSGPGASCNVLSGRARKKCIAKAIRKCKRKRSKPARKKCIRRVRKNSRG